jgi:putative acetyltransferase
VTPDLPHAPGGPAVTASIRPERPDDVEPIRELLREAFGVEKVVTLVDLLRASSVFIPTLSFVAETDAGVVGHVLLTRTTLRTDGPGSPGAVDVLNLSPLSVRPAVQGRGLGGTLLRTAVAAARDRGESLVVLEGDPGYYGRFGFRRASELGIGRPSPRIPDEGFQALPLDAAGARLRGAVQYPAPFWDADCVGPP